jgi:rhodanese-related sulfurtransferase
MLFKTAIFFLLAIFSCGLQAIELGLVSAEQLQSLQQHNQALVVDIRTASEWQTTGTIPNSHKLQAYAADGSFDAEKWLADLHKLKSSADQQIILVCRSGNRSRKLGELLVQKGENNIYHLGDGIQGWIKSGYPINNGSISKQQ